MSDTPPPDWTSKPLLERLQWLTDHKGLELPAGAGQVFLSSSVSPEKWGQNITIYKAHIFDDPSIGDSSVLHDASIKGQSYIGAECKLGLAGPVVLEQATLGTGVSIKGGSVKDSVILQEASLGYGSSIRQGCLIDAEVSTGQFNDFKNTYLGIATLIGSSTNFCDIALSGGKPGRSVDQSEIGSGCIHFNFGIHGKKWGSWIGSMEALFLDCERCFLGGKTSLIGPVLVPDGIITLVDSQIRNPFKLENPQAKQNLVFRHGPLDGVEKQFNPETFGRLGSKFVQTREIIGRYRALSAWFRLVRSALGESQVLVNSARRMISHVVAERLHWLNQILQELPQSSAELKKERRNFRALAHEKILRLWTEGNLNKELGAMDPQLEGTKALEDRFAKALDLHLAKNPATGSVSARITALPEDLRKMGREWLRAIVAESNAFKVS